MRCLVLGATGYVGGRLVPRLAAAGHEVRCLVRNQAKGEALERTKGVESVLGDAMNADSVLAAMDGVDVVYHLVHSMDRHDFSDADQAVAENVALAADGTASRIVYLGGLRPPGPDAGGTGLSRHLASRAEVGDIFLAGPVPAVVLQASIIIGSGSTSFEMLRHLAERLPVMPAPKWLDNPTQPVAIADVLHYMVAAADLPDGVNRTIDIGGPDVLTYRELISRYARIVGQPTPIWLPTPIFPAGLSALAVSGLTPVSAVTAEPLLESLAHPMVCAAGEPESLLPEPPGGRLDFEQAVRRALNVGPPDSGAAGGHAGTAGSNGRSTRRDPGYDGAGDRHSASDDAAYEDPAYEDPAYEDPALPAAHDPAGSGAPVLEEERRLPTSASPEDLWRVIESIGGDNGWYTLPLVWQARGVLDRALGGVGDYRGRRDPRSLRAGEVLDWWRVEDVQPGKRLQLRAEMRMPGSAWLEMSVGTAPDGRTEYRQRVTFRPAGPAGHVYWWGQRLGHEVVFGVMARRLVRAAERLAKERVG